MPGLVFEERLDDAPLERQSIASYDEAQQMLVTEESWRHPEEFGHMASTFENHVTMIGKLSKERGIVNEYSADLLALKTDLVQLQNTMMSYDQFYQMIHACPEEFGMSPSFTTRIFGNDTTNLLNHADHYDGQYHEADQDDNEANSKTSKSKKKLNWLSLFVSKPKTRKT